MVLALAHPSFKLLKEQNQHKCANVFFSVEFIHTKYLTTLPCIYSQARCCL